MAKSTKIISFNGNQNTQTKNTNKIKMKNKTINIVHNPHKTHIRHFVFVGIQVQSVCCFAHLLSNTHSTIETSFDECSKQKESVNPVSSG